MANSNDITYKVVVLGDAGVGKTSIVKWQVQDTFNFTTTPNIGSITNSMSIQVNETLVQLMIWDTAGQERYSPLVPMYVRGVDIAVIVASYDHEESRDDIENWMNIINESEEKPFIIFVINKIDLEQQFFYIRQSL